MTVINMETFSMSRVETDAFKEKCTVSFANGQSIDAYTVDQEHLHETEAERASLVTRLDALSSRTQKRLYKQFNEIIDKETRHISGGDYIHLFGKPDFVGANIEAGSDLYNFFEANLRLQKRNRFPSKSLALIYSWLYCIVVLKGYPYRDSWTKGGIARFKCGDCIDFILTCNVASDKNDNEAGAWYIATLKEHSANCARQPYPTSARLYAKPKKVFAPFHLELLKMAQECPLPAGTDFRKVVIDLLLCCFTANGSITPPPDTNLYNYKLLRKRFMQIERDADPAPQDKRRKLAS